MNYNQILSSGYSALLQFRKLLYENKYYFPQSAANLTKKITVKKIQMSRLHNPSLVSKPVVDRTDDLPKRLVDWENDAKAK